MANLGSIGSYPIGVHPIGFSEGVAPPPITNILILDSWTTQTTTIDLNKTVSAGTNRLLLVVVACEDTSACNVTSMTYGGQTMFLVGNGTTDAKGSNTGGGSDTFLEIWGVLETEIAAASGTLIDVTMDNGSISEYMIAAGSYENVDQSGNGSSGSVDDVGVLTTGDTNYDFVSGDNIEVTDEGLAFMACISRASTTFTSVSPLIEAFDFTSSGAASSGAGDLIAANDTAYTASMDAGSNNRGVGVIVTFAVAVSGATTEKTLTYTAVGTASLTKKITFVKTLSSSGTGTLSLSKKISKTLGISAIGTSTIIKKISIIKSITATGTASMTKGFIFTVSANMSAVGTSSLNTLFIVGKTFLVVATGTSSLVKKISKSFSVSGTCTPSVSKKTSKTLNITATGTATTQEALVATKTLTPTATGTLSTVANFIASSGSSIVIFIKKIALRLGLGL